MPAKPAREDWMLPTEDEFADWLALGASARRESAPPSAAAVRDSNATGATATAVTPLHVGSVSPASAPDRGCESDDEEEDWMDALAEAVDSLGNGQPQSDGEDEDEESEPAGDTAWVPRCTPTLLAESTDTDAHRVGVLMQWLKALPKDTASLHGAVVGIGEYGVGVFASEDLPAGHVALRIHKSRVVTLKNCEQWSDRYYGLGTVLASLEPRRLGDGRWSPKCSRSTKLAIWLVVERALALEAADEAKQGFQSATRPIPMVTPPRASASRLAGELSRALSSPADDLPASPESALFGQSEPEREDAATEATGVPAFYLESPCAAPVGYVRTPSPPQLDFQGYISQTFLFGRLHLSLDLGEERHRCLRCSPAPLRIRLRRNYGNYGGRNLTRPSPKARGVTTRPQCCVK